MHFVVVCKVSILYTEYLEKPIGIIIMRLPITSNTEFKAHFPVMVMQRDFDQVSDLNDSLSEVILSMEQRFKESDDNAAKQSHIATEGGYQTAGKVNFFNLKHESVTAFREQILKPAISDYLQNVFEDAASQLSPFPFGWANVLRDGDWQRPHCHASNGNVVSGVYYVNVPSEEPPKGCIDFLNPLTVSQHHGYSPCQRVQPSAGKLILFPPYHIHYVHPVSQTEPRVVIAFDVLGHGGNQLVF